MNLTIEKAFVGIDLTNQRRSFTCAILDSARRVLFCGSLTMQEWQSFLTPGLNILAAINSPLTLNLGYMADEEYRQQLAPAPPPNRYAGMRVCEYQLLSRGLSTTRTPKGVGKFSVSQQRAFKFASELGVEGFQFWPFPNSRLQMFETQAEAAFASLMGVKPFPINSLEGRIQRQLALQNQAVPVADPMRFFEEITRHRLLIGKLPDDEILSPVQLNALVAAFTAWKVIHRPAEYVRLGEADEGTLILPTLPIKD